MYYTHTCVCVSTDSSNWAELKHHFFLVLSLFMIADVIYVRSRFVLAFVLWQFFLADFSVKYI